jgi:hypothetical protein
VKRAELGKRKTSHGEEEEEFSLNRNQKIGRHRRRLTVLRSSYFFVFFRASSVAPHISWLTSSNVRKVPKMATFFFFFFFFYDYRKDKKESADAADTVLPITRPFCVCLCAIGFLLLSFPFWGVQKNRQVDHWGGNVVKDFYFFFLFRLFRTRGISLSWPSSVVCRVTSLFSIRESRSFVRSRKKKTVASNCRERERGNMSVNRGGR